MWSTVKHMLPPSSSSKQQQIKLLFRTVWAGILGAFRCPASAVVAALISPLRGLKGHLKPLKKSPGSKSPRRGKRDWTVKHQESPKLLVTPKIIPNSIPPKLFISVKTCHVVTWKLQKKKRGSRSRWSERCRNEGEE